jgi:hypothetical protein
MTLEKVLEIAREVLENENIPKDNLTISYKLNKDIHRKLDEELFYKTNNSLSNFKHNKTIELNLGGITFLFEIL